MVKESVVIERDKIYNMDCLEGMKGIPDKSVDMILTDLPYGTTRNRWDTVIAFDKLWSQYERVIKDNGAIILFGQGLFFIDLVNSNRKLYRHDIVWDKVLTTGFLNAKKMPLRQHEQIAVFYKKLPTYNPQFSVGKPLHGRGTAYLEKENVNNNYGEFKALKEQRKGSTQKYPTSVIQFQKPHPAASIHPTEKPVELLSYLIKTYTNEGEVVLDSTIGSGSTAVSCLETGRSYIGFELDENYFKLAVDRVNEVKSII